MNQFEQIEKKLLGSQVEDKIMTLITEKEIDVGQKLPSESVLTERFGVGRSTVREAVKSLVSKGVLEVKQGSGTYVIRRCSIEEDLLGLSRFSDQYQLALELFEVRLMIEPDIASLACQNATEEEKIRLVELCDEVERLYLAGENHLKADTEFHTHIAKCSRNRVVETLIPLIQTAVFSFGNLTFRSLQKETIETHRGITNAILEGDMIGAKSEMNMHLNYNRQRLIRIKREKEQAE
ncbi:MAG: FadR family transcriptional regulator [Clostridiales bacterium]|nr:FadR family transcriptional regulator [Clostridiales bacterium]